MCHYTLTVCGVVSVEYVKSKIRRSRLCDYFLVLLLYNIYNMYNIFSVRDNVL